MPSDLRIPRHDGALLAIPPLSEWDQLAETLAKDFVAENSSAHPNSLGSLGGLPLAAFRQLARGEALQLARQYLASFGELDADSASDTAEVAEPCTGPWILSGHQPELFHPGVWVKNFAIAAVAARHHGIALNVLIDNDTIKASAIRIPTGEPDQLLLGHVPFDAWEGEFPYEETTVSDEELFATFPDRVLEEMTPLAGEEPMLRDYWDHVLATKPVTNNLGERLAAGRRALEQAHEVRNLEVPLSHLCQGEAFCRLAAQLLLDAAHFQTTHNELLARYRNQHGIKSKNHPVADLAEHEGFVDTPLWIWKSGEPHRQRLFVRRDGNTLRLRVERQTILELAVDSADPIGSLAQELRNPARLGGWKIRSRALLTTLFLRLGLADLFVHGIGGGKYDELTDELMKAYFGIEPPAFAILSCTVHLGIETTPTELTRCEVDQLLRDMKWNPDRHLDEMLLEQSPLAEWIEEKMALMETEPPTRRERVQRYRRFRELNEQLREYLGGREQTLRRERSLLLHEEDNAAVATRRDYPFCLYPLAKLTRYYAHHFSPFPEPAKS